MRDTPSGRKKRSVQAPSDPAQDQIALFPAQAEPPAQPAAKTVVPATPNTVLRGLLGALVRASGLSHPEVNRRINRKIGVSSRSGASEEVVLLAVAAADAWLETLQAPAGRRPGGDRAGAAPPSRTARPVQPSGPPPTLEQQEAVETKTAGHHIALQAGAGTGKTTTLGMLARSDSRRGLYLAFNTVIAQEAAGKFPANVPCRTGHSLAMRDVGRRFQHRLNGPREPAWKAGAALGISPNMVVTIGDRKVTNKGLSYMTFRTVQRFCFSADTDFRVAHLPKLNGIPDDLRWQMAEVILPFARRAWQELQDPNGGIVPFQHDHYLKMWALTKPMVRADFVMLDEAQDTNPVLEEVFNAQRAHAQLIMVGDSAQAIYGWRGARDVMADFPGQQLTLSQSFRFGPALAEEANRWLAIVDAPLRLQGAPTLDTQIGPVADPDVVLCRTNGGTMQAILQLLAERRRVALVGGGKALKALARAAADLKAGRRTDHHELVLFRTWGEVQEYAAYDPSGQDLAALVEVVDEYGVDVILDAVSRLHSEDDAEVTVSTAHKAKGREWASVKIFQDFEPRPSDDVDAEGKPLPQPINVDEARLAYVAITRARHRLDLGGLAWIHEPPEGSPQQVPEVGRRHLPLVPDPPVSPPASPWDLLGPVPDQDTI